MAFTKSTTVPEPIDDVFAWHTRPGAATRLMPPWQRVRVLAEADDLASGRAVLRFPPGWRWVAAHDAAGYVDGRRFVDELVSRPAPRVVHWRHTHDFDAVDAHTTRVVDTVDTNVPDRLLTRVFAYRRRQLADDLAALARLRAIDPGPRTVAVTGSSGLVGRALCALLGTSGHRVIRLVRHATDGADERTWNPTDPAPGLLDDVDAVVHLAGAPIAGRFTERHKAKVRDSRVEPTRRLAQAATAARNGPGVFVSASAIGYYGADRGETELDEDAGRGTGFLADVVADWETATAPAADAGIRTVQIRTGIVVDPRGGMLGLLLPLFRAGLGGRLGSGRQWFSWIGIDDLCDVYARSVVDDALAGPVNAVAPNPVRNAEFTRTLAGVLRRPAVIPVPAFAPALVLGREGATEFALANQRVRPDRLTDADHVFRSPDLEPTLRHLLGRPPRH